MVVSERWGRGHYTGASIVVILAGMIAYWANGVRDNYGNQRTADALDEEKAEPSPPSQTSATRRGASGSLMGEHLPLDERKRFFIDATKGFITEDRWNAIAKSMRESNPQGLVKVRVDTQDGLPFAVARAIYSALLIGSGLGGGFGAIDGVPDHDGLVVFGPADDPLVLAVKKALSDAHIEFRVGTEEEGFTLNPQFENAGISVGRIPAGAMPRE